MLNRRCFLLLTGGGLVAACGGGEPPPPPPTTLTLEVTGSPGMNPGPDRTDRAVTVSVLRLNSPGALDAADPFTLQSDPAAALGPALAGSEQLVIPPGGSASTTMTLPPEVTHIGLVAALREPGGRVWRSTIPVVPNAATTTAVRLGPAGMTLS